MCTCSVNIKSIFKEVALILMVLEEKFLYRTLKGSVMHFIYRIK